MPYKDKAKKREQNKRYRETNREKRLEHYRQYREVNREKLRDQGKRYYAANSEKRLEQNKRYREAYPERSRANKLKRKYGITIEVYNTLIDGQHFLCSICQKPDFEDGRALHVDHDHKTGWVRGLLCNKCNVGLANFSDSPALLQRAIEYLHFNNREGKLPINQTQKDQSWN